MSVAPHDRRTLTPLEPLVDRVEATRELDRVGTTVGKLVRGVLSPGALKDAIAGTWLGHPIHPTLTDGVIGFFLSATAIDLLGGSRSGRAQQRLIGAGLAAAVPTVVTGVTDYADSERGSGAVRRVGVLHAFSNFSVIALYGGSLIARVRGERGTGTALSLGGAAMLTVGGYLGGHLTLARGIGTNQTAYDPGPDDWVAAADVAQLPDGQPTRVVIDETPVLVLRNGDRILALHDRCAHRGCPLHEGEIDGDHVICPCHGSTFDLRTGAIVRGPATHPQPAFEARVVNERVELRRAFG
ncbi:MAG TPA: Rieske 2Fe-2S domain-containing protein [Conexibacter sp.]